MEYSAPIQILVDEHTVILSVLDSLEKVAAGDERGGGFSREFYEKAFDFFPAFADTCHHGKEEAQLFPLLEERGIPREGGPIGCMLAEHDDGRAHVKAVKKALPKAAQGDRAAQETVRSEALAFASLLRNHIFKENNILFTMADRVLSAQDKELLEKKFNCSHHSPLPPGAHEKYEALGHELGAWLTECAV